jgi:hypothetical protein
MDMKYHLYYIIVLFLLLALSLALSLLLDWSLNSGLCAYKAGTVPLEPHLHPFCSDYFGDGDLRTICSGLPGKSSMDQLIYICVRIALI